MTLEVDYVPWANLSGANVYSPAVYQALSILGTGVEPGLADPAQANTTWRLSAMMSAAMGNFIANVLQINVLDDGNISNLIANLTAAISAGSAIKPGRIVTSSSTLNMLVTDYAIGLERTVSLAAQVVNLPSAAALNQEFRVDDLVGNFQAFPVTITPPAGHSIATLPTWIMNSNRQSNIFHYFGSSIWGVK